LLARFRFRPRRSFQQLLLRPHQSWFNTTTPLTRSLRCSPHRCPFEQTRVWGTRHVAQSSRELAWSWRKKIRLLLASRGPSLSPSTSFAQNANEGSPAIGRQDSRELIPGLEF